MRRLALPAVVLAAAAGLGFAADSDDITIRAYPSVVTYDQRVVVSGIVTPARANEYVAVQGKECGVPGAFFRGLWGASTNEGGGWEAEFYVRTTTVLRAVAGSDISADLTIRVRAPVHLAPMPGRPVRYRVAAWGAVSFRGKRVVIQRFDPNARKWRAVRTLVLDDTSSQIGFRLAVPRSTTLRAVLPLSQARPCYLAGYSKLVRT